MGGWSRDLRSPGRPGQVQPAGGRGNPRGARDGQHHRHRARAHAAVHGRRAAVAGVPAALQPLRARHGLRGARRQCHPRADELAPAGPHRSVGHAVPEPARRIRRRRAGGGRHVRRARGQAVRRRHHPLPGVEPAPGQPGHAGRAPGVDLLGAEHGGRRRRALAAVRSRHGDQPGHRDVARQPRSGRAHRLLPQPAAALVPHP